MSMIVLCEKSTAPLIGIKTNLGSVYNLMHGIERIMQEFWGKFKDPRQILKCICHIVGFKQMNQNHAKIFRSIAAYQIRKYLVYFGANFSNFIPWL